MGDERTTDGPDQEIATHPAAAAPGGRDEPRVYVASRSEHGPMWQGFRAQHPGLAITSSWIDGWAPGDGEGLGDLWVRAVADVRSSSALIAFHRSGETWKGAFIEIGVALSMSLPVIVVGDPPGSWVAHPLVRRAHDLDHAAVLAAGPAPKPAAPSEADRSR